MVFLIAFLVIEFILAGYKSSQREQILRLRENEILQNREEIAQLSARARWWDTAAARVYLKKLHNDVKLPGERVLMLVPKIISWEYSVNTAISEAKQEELLRQELTVPEKWNRLLFWI
jgi:hypothetical protein